MEIIRSVAILLCVSIAASLPFAFAYAQAGVGVRDEPERILLQNARLSMALGKVEKGAIVSMVDGKTGRELVAAQASPRLFQLTFCKRGDANGQQFTVSSHDAASFTSTVAKDEASATATLRYQGFALPDVTVTCTAAMKEQDPLVYLRLSAHVPDSLVLEKVEFPFLASGAPLGDDVADDAAVIGHTKGGVLRRPAEWKIGHGISATQPGSMAAQFGCYYDDQGGVFTAAHDGKGYPKAVSMRRISEGIEISWSHHCFTPKPFELDYDIVLTTFHASNPPRPTDWRDAADIYKQWALTQPWCAHTYAERKDIPIWMKTGPAMVRFSRHWLADPQRIEDWFKLYWQKFFEKGPPLVVAYWGWEKVGTWVTPDYFPVYPSDEQFKQLVQQTRKLNCHTFLWPSGYHWTVTYRLREDGTFEWDDRQRFDQIGRTHAVIKRDGTIYKRECRWLRGGSNVTMCPGDAWTRQWLNDIALKIAKRGAELIQIDQVVGARFPACYSTAHGHPPGPGIWQAQVFAEQLSTIYTTCQKLQPEIVIGFEEPNEHFIQYVGIQDYRDFQVLAKPSKPHHEPASLFNYLYHEFLPTFQSNPRPGDRLMQAYCLVNGQIPHFVPSFRVGPGPLLVNGGFEEWTADAPLGWSKVSEYKGKVWRGKYYRDETQKHEGQFSLRLENESEDDVVQVSQNVPVGESGLAIGKTYRLSVWMKIAHLAQQNRIPLGTFAPGLKNTGSWQIPIPAKAGEEWQRGEATFTVPEDSVMLRIMLHVNGKAKVWMDDVTLEEVQPDGAISPVMRKETPPDHELMLQWVDLFHGKGRPYLLFGKMLHPPKLETDTMQYGGHDFPVMLHNAYRAPDGTEGMVIVNITDDPQKGVLHWKGKERTIELAGWEVQLILE